MCNTKDNDHFPFRLKYGDVLNVYSTNYPAEYPTYNFACVRVLSTNGGIFRIQILDSSIAVEDTIGIGAGHIPTFESTIYSTNTGVQMPQRDNHPKDIYVLSTFVGSFMWIVFGASYAEISKNLHQYSTINSGFLLQISVMKYHGKALIAYHVSVMIKRN